MPPKKISSMNFRELIDLAIGSPEPGHVNFYALHCLLYSFAEKLNIVEKTVDCAKFDLQRKFDEIQRVCSKKRLAGGADTEDAPVEQPVEEQLTAEAPPDDAAAAPESTAAETEVVGEPEAPAAEEPAAEEPQPPPAEEPPAAEVEVVDEVKETPVAEDAQEKPQVEQQEELLEKTQLAAAGTNDSKKEFSSALADITSTMEQIKYRLSELEAVGKASPAAEMTRGLAIMKDQLETAMEQVINLADTAILKKTSAKKTNQMRELSGRLRTLQRENVYISSTHRFKRADDRSLTSEELMEEEVALEEELEEEVELKSESEGKTAESPNPVVPSDQLELEMHLCYSPQKLLSQLIDLKSEFCLLTNKVNEISATLLEQESLNTMMIIGDIQDQMREMKFNMSNLRESMEHCEAKLVQTDEAFEELSERMNQMSEEKIDKIEAKILLADKASYSDLQRKVSLEQLQEVQCRFERQFCELTKLIKLNEKNMLQVAENLRTSLGFDTIEAILNKFKEKIEVDIQKLHDSLQKYLDATDDDCAAAGARIKVLQDLACLSCDTTCVMRTREKARVGKLPNAHTTDTMAPLVTYEVGSIRKSGVMGYYRKDEFPQAPNAWMNRRNLNTYACVPRHAGGPHTVHTAKEHVEKVLLSKKNTIG